MDFIESNFTKKTYKKGALYFINGFDFVTDIPNREKKHQQDFIGKSPLLEFSEREKINIYITNQSLDTQFEKINDKNYLVDIKKYHEFYVSLKNKSGFDLAHAFFTNNLDFKNSFFTQEDIVELLRREDVKEAISNNGIKTHKDGLSFNLSELTESEIWSELEKRGIETGDFIRFANKCLDSKIEMNIDELQNISKSIDFKKIEEALKTWGQNSQNSDEVGFWHKFLKENSWIISQVFAAPYAIFQSELYIGGHYSGERKGSKNTDFGYQHKYSKNIAIIEIKAPTTKLVENEQYDGRDGIYPMSKSLMGSISQVLNQKDLLTKDFNQNNRAKDFDVWNPKIILIIGSEKNENLDLKKRSCFELFKQSQRDVEIITFDDLFEKISNLADIFSKD